MKNLIKAKNHNKESQRNNRKSRNKKKSKFSQLNNKLQESKENGVENSKPSKLTTTIDI